MKNITSERMRHKKHVLLCNIDDTHSQAVKPYLIQHFETLHTASLNDCSALKSNISIAIFSTICQEKNWQKSLEDFIQNHINCQIIVLEDETNRHHEQLLNTGVDVYLPLSSNTDTLIFAIKKCLIILGFDNDPVAAKVDRSGRLNTVSHLATGLLHEINNPLAIIQGSVDLIRDKFSDQEMTQKEIDLALVPHVAATQRIASLLSSLRSFSHASISKELREFVDIVNLINDVLTIIIPAYHRDGIEISIQADCHKRLVNGSRSGLEQIILSLLTNAKEAMIGQAGKIEITLTNTDENLFIGISDTGTGIPEKIEKQVFESFFSTKANGEGLGLGLSSIRRIIEDLNGSIWFESVPSEGSHFHVRLPTAIPRFLVVEDDPFIIATYKSFIKNIPCVAAYASDGDAACELFESQPPDLVLLDYELPKRSGLDVLRFIRQRNQSVPVVVITANTEKSISDQFMACGANEALVKPIAPPRLNELTGQYLFGLYNSIKTKTDSKKDRQTNIEGKKILVVDDEEMIRNIYMHTFKRLKIHCVEACNGKEGVDTARSETFDLVILDYNMPVMNGVEALLEIKKHNPYLPVIIVTGSVGNERVGELSKKGARKVLFKPISTKNLRQVVLNILSEDAG